MTFAMSFSPTRHDRADGGTLRGFDRARHPHPRLAGECAQPGGTHPDQALVDDLVRHHDVVVAREDQALDVLAPAHVQDVADGVGAQAPAAVVHPRAIIVLETPAAPTSPTSATPNAPLRSGPSVRPCCKYCS